MVSAPAAVVGAARNERAMLAVKIGEKSLA
jgi:hypothetical protein